MENWCFNTVRFTGEPDVTDMLTNFFYELAQEGQRTGEGQLPEFVTVRNGLMYNLGWSGKCYFYATKGVPNTAALVEIADRYGLDFRHEYEEIGNCLYGVARYKEGALNITDLDEDDFQQFHHNDDTHTYEFEGEHYEDCDEILKILLERKIAIQKLTT